MAGMNVTQQYFESPVSIPPAGSTAGRPLEMRELRYFHGVARAGNFGRAARELSIGQPSLTRQIHKLENILGVSLFIRHGRGVTLTPAGACLLERLDIIMPLLDSPLQEAPAPEVAPGSVSLALPAECAPMVVPALIARCRDRWPRLTLTVREGDSASLEEWVTSGRVDIAVLQDPAALDDLEIDPVLTERLGLVVSARSPRGDAGKPVRARDLAGLPMILPNARHWIRRRVETAWFRRGIGLDRVQQVESVTVAKELVRNDLGCSVLPYAAVRDEVEHGRLIFRPIEQMSLLAVHAITWRKATSLTIPVINDFALTLRGVMVELASHGQWAGAHVAGTPGLDAGMI